MIRQLFYNTPARRKFLKTPMTEASHVSELMTRMALSHPEISFQFINNGQSRIHTSGNGSLKDVIYHIYGREIAMNLIEIQTEAGDVKISGFLGKPVISRGNRNFENYFINGRYVKNQIVSKAIEDAYKDFTMQHKYPFVALQITMPGEEVDVNVHPAKLEIRFQNQQAVYNAVYEAVDRGLRKEELIPQVKLEEPKEIPRADVPSPAPAPMPKKETKPSQAPAKEERNLDYFMQKMKERVAAYHNRESSAEVAAKDQIFRPLQQADRIREAAVYAGPVLSWRKSGKKGWKIRQENRNHPGRWISLKKNSWTGRSAQNII